MSAEVSNSGATEWTRSVVGRLNGFFKTESASSGVLLAAIVVALVWASIFALSYDEFWNTKVAFAAGDFTIDMPLRDWISRGLMTFFFLVVGLEARRQFDLGELRDRSQLVIPIVSGIAAMAVPVAIFLAVNAGQPSAAGWGAAMSTDTALALGLLTLVGHSVPERLRGFIVTVFIVDDLVALIVIAIVYSTTLQIVPLIVGVVAFLAFPIMLRFSSLPSLAYIVAGVICWGGLLFGGVDPLVAGLAIGLIAPAYSPGRDNLEQATGLVRQFREQPTPQLARSASAGLIGSLSPNERLTTLYNRTTSFVIVPLFALSNAGVAITWGGLVAAAGSPITIGIVVAYVVGKPVAVVATSGLIRMISRGRFRPPVGWGAVGVSGTIAGVGFTVAVLISNLAFRGADLEHAKIGILAAAFLSAIITWVQFRVYAALSPAARSRVLQGNTEEIVDLCTPVDPKRDHIRGMEGDLVTVVEYGDFECPYCGRAEQGVRELRTDASVRFVWRHLPLTDVHPHAQLAAQASEAAARQDSFWEMHDLLLQNQDHLTRDDIIGLARQLGLDLDRFEVDLDDPDIADRIEADVVSADASGVSGTPTFFIDGRRHYGAYDFESLRLAVVEARERTRAR